MKLNQYFDGGIKLDNSIKFAQDSNSVDDLLNEMRNFGLRVDFLKEGSLQRVGVNAIGGQRPDKSGETSGWYIYHQINPEYACCVYGNWRTGEEKKFFTGSTASLSKQEQKQLYAKLEEVKAKAAEDKARKQEETAEYVKDKFSRT